MKYGWMPLMFLMLTVPSDAASPILRPGQSPLVTLRLVFRTGAAHDPPGKHGLAAMTAAMIAKGGTRNMSYQQIVEALFPMAVNVESNVDKEMTTFGAETHIDNLDAFYALFRAMLLEPGWREEDLRRLKDDTVNFLQVSLRGNNDEELGKEALYSEIYTGHPYGHHSMGRVSGIRSITLDDLKKFHAGQYTQANLTIALAGGYPEAFAKRIESDFAALPKGRSAEAKLPAPKALRGREMLMIEKQTRSVAMSLGFPIDVRRGHPDYAALLLAQSWLGQHRTSGVRLFDRIREARGLNYGDYAYIEYFPRGMFKFEPDPNLSRRQQIFQVWIRPVEPATAHFTLRLAMHEIERFHREGLSREDFERTRQFLGKYVNLLTKTKRAELGYAIDSDFYGIADYNSYLRSELARLTRERVNQAIRKHLAMDNMKIVVVGQDCEKLRAAIVSEAPCPMRYNSPKPEDILEEDKIVEKHPLRIKSGNTRIVKVETVFE